MAKPNKNRNSMRKQVYEVLERYAGKFITPQTLMMELTDKNIVVTRETIRKWLRLYGCEQVQVGQWKVPDVQQHHNQPQVAAAR